MGVYGLTYEIKNGFVENLRLLNGKPLHPRKRYRVALNSYVLASGGKRNPIIRRLAYAPESRMEMIKTSTRDAVIQYIQKHSPLFSEEIMK